MIFVAAFAVFSNVAAKLSSKSANQAKIIHEHVGGHCLNYEETPGNIKT